MRTYSSIVSDIRPADFDAIKQEYSNGSVGFADLVKAMGIAPSISEDDLTVLAAEFAEGPLIVASSGLTKAEEKSLKEALERLNAVNRPAYLGGMERHNLTEAIRAIHYRLNPTPVDRLLDTAERLSKPLEHTFDELARLQAEAVLG